MKLLCFRSIQAFSSSQLLPVAKLVFSRAEGCKMRQTLTQLSVDNPCPLVHSTVGRQSAVPWPMFRRPNMACFSLRNVGHFLVQEVREGKAWEKPGRSLGETWDKLGKSELSEDQ